MAVDTPGTRGAAALVSELCDVARRASWFDGDISTWSGAWAAVDHAVSEFGVLHALVNTAGVLRDRSVAKITEDDWDVSLTSNLKTCASMTVAAVGVNGEPVAMRQSCVHRSSIARRPRFSWASHFSSTTALLWRASSVRRWPRRELEPYGIRVNALRAPRSGSTRPSSVAAQRRRQQGWPSAWTLAGRTIPATPIRSSTCTTTDTCRRSSGTSSRSSRRVPDAFCSSREGGSAT